MCTILNKIQKNLKNFYENNPKVFRRRICKGPPPEYRWAAWKVISGALQHEVSGAYDESLRKADQFDEEEHKVLNQINLDLNRTYPWHPFFNSEKYGVIGQNVLKKSLRAYAMYNPEVGYTQSINFVMGFFLIVNEGRDEEAFWQFIAISNKNHSYGKIENFDGGLGEFYCDNFPLYRQFVYQFDTLFEEKLPQLKNHFDKLGFYSDIYLQNWFMTIFNCFPMDMCIRLWDHLLIEGLPYMFKFPLAIMEILESDLLNNDLEGVNDIIMSLRNPHDNPLPPAEEVISRANKVKVTKADLLKLKKEYESHIEKNPHKEIKRLNTLFYDLNEEEKASNIQSMVSNSANEAHPVQIQESTEKKARPDTSKVMKIIDKEIDDHKNISMEKRSSKHRLKPKAKDSILLKEKGRISLPNEQKDQQIQPNYEDLRKMPFSLADEDINQFSSPMQRILSVDDACANPNSLQMEAYDENQLVDCCEDEMYKSFDIFQEEISKIEDDEASVAIIKNKQNNMTDYSNLYLNLSNKISYPETVIIDSNAKQHDYKIRHILHTTGKSNHRTGENLTYTDCFKTSTNLKKCMQQEANEISVDSVSDHKSYFCNKPFAYSEFDGQSEKESNVTDFRQTLTIKNKNKNIRPGIIKGFCSSESSIKSKAKKRQIIPEKEIDLKHQFYGSGIDFHNTNNNNNIDNPLSKQSKHNLDKSQKHVNLDFRLSVDSSGEINRSHDVN